MLDRSSKPSKVRIRAQAVERGDLYAKTVQGVISVFNVANKLKKVPFSNKKEILSYSSFNRASFVTFVTVKVTI